MSARFFLSSDFEIFLADFDDQDFLGCPQKWKRVADRAPTFTGILARHHDATKLEWTNDVGHHQDGPACPQQNGAGLDQVTYVAARAGWPDKDNVRRPRLPRHKLGRQFKSGAPFHLLEMLALNAELLAHLLEAGCRHAIVVRGGFAVDHNASGGEGRPQGQARDSNERCLKPVSQIERELDSLFAIALDVDVDHYRCNRHRLFPVVPGSLFASFPDRP